jgi:catechol-2,3-dioxygenase
VLYEADRAFTKSIHIRDPDAHEVELYIDTSDAWRTLAQPPFEAAT